MILMATYLFPPPNRFKPIPNMDFSEQISCQCKTPRVRYVIYNTCVYKEVVMIPYPVSFFLSAIISHRRKEHSLIKHFHTHMNYKQWKQYGYTFTTHTHFCTLTQTVAVQHTAHLMAGRATPTCGRHK